MIDKEAQETLEKAMSVIVGNDDEKDTQEIHEESGRKKFVNRLIYQFFLTLFFGFTGVPMLWRTRKHYGVFVFGLFIVSTVLTAVWGFWYLYILVGFLWLFDLVAICGRIRYYALGKRTHRRSIAREMQAETDNSSQPQESEKNEE